MHLLIKSTQGEYAIADGILCSPKTVHFEPEYTIDASNLTVLPGLVDLKCNVLQEQLAVSNGFTSLAVPCTHSQKNAQTLKIPLVSLLEDHLEKLFYHGVQGLIVPISHSYHLKQLRNIYRMAAHYQVPLFITPLDASFLAEGAIHEGKYNARLGLPGIPVIAETSALTQHLLLISEVGLKAHFHCISSKEALSIIRLAKEKGLPITADTAIHYLYRSEEDLEHFKTDSLVLPPLRSKKDQAALRAAVLDGTLDAICSDHTPVTIEGKRCTFAKAEVGIASLNDYFARILDIFGPLQQKLIDAVCINPARILGIPYSTLEPGSPADLTIVDPQNGKVHYTIKAGKILYTLRE